MDKLFDSKDILTVATADQAVVGTKGYFGDNLVNLIADVRQGKVETLTDVTPDVTYCFESNNDLHYIFFLPADRVKNKVKVYRPIKTIDELFRFLTPDFEIRNNEKSNRYKKVETLLRRKITIRRKEDNFIKVMVITDIYFYDNDDNNDIYLNGDLLKYLFCKYEILRNGEWQPFGIKVEEQDSERGKDKDVDTSLSDYMDKRIVEIAKD